MRLGFSLAFAAMGASLVSAGIVIDQMYSSNWNSSKVQEFSNPKIAFSAGTAMTATSNSTKTAALQIGLNIFENQVHQVVDSFGGGITDSVSIVLQDFKTNHPKEYDDLLHLLFSQDSSWLQKGGIGLTAVRVPLGACDFGVSPYTYDDTADGSEDPDMELFTINKAPKLWKTLKDILAINPTLRIFTAPWSAPGWMKEGGDESQPLFGGHLKAGYEQAMAKYLIRSMVEIKKLKNIDIYALSLLNEPRIPRLSYPTMRMTALQSSQVAQLVRKGLDAAGLKSIKLIANDFNWDDDQVKWTLDVLNNDPTPWYGVAWHGYAGDPSGQGKVSKAYPDKPTFFTEFTQITQYFSEPYKNMKNTANKLLIGSIRYESQSVILWNLALLKDQDGFTKPHLDGICSNCNAAILMLPESTDASTVQSISKSDTSHVRTEAEANAVTTDKKESESQRRRRKRSDVEQPDPAPQTLDTSSEAIMPQDVKDVKMTGSDSTYVSNLFKRSSDYLVLAHLSAAVRPQGTSTSYSRRIGVTSTDETTEFGGRLLAQAFRQDNVKPGITRFSVIILNQNDHYETGLFEDATAVISFRGMVANVVTSPGLYTLSWEAPTNAASDTSAAQDKVVADAAAVLKKSSAPAVPVKP